MSSFLTSLVLLLCAGAGAEIFTSMIQMQHALHSQQLIASRLQQYIRDERQRLDQLEREAISLKEESQGESQTPEQLLAHPVNAFLYSRSFSNRWSIVKNLLHNQSAENLNSFDTDIKMAWQGVPKNEDLKGAATALFRLQDTYKLPTAGLARGDKMASVKSPVLTAQQCHELGVLAYDDRDFYHAALWMNEALKRLGQEQNKTLERARVLEYLSFLYGEHKQYREALRVTEELLALEPNHSFGQSNKEYYDKQLESTKADYEKRGEDGSESATPLMQRPTVEPYEQRYEALCRGEQVEENPYDTTLTCRYTTNGNPLLMLEPLKVEEVYRNPNIILLHGFISDYEIEVITNLSIPNLERAGVFKLEGQTTNIADYRTSKHSWLSDFDHPVIKQLTKRVGAATGLNQDMTEMLQVQNYGIGGHYSAHYDHARKGEEYVFDAEQGNRIATLMYYMNDVGAGGSTVFTEIGLRVVPAKGMAVFWHNLLRSGDGDPKTMHAGCPVLVGSKWVANKWIHERGQEFIRPCLLHEHL